MVILKKVFGRKQGMLCKDTTVNDERIFSGKNWTKKQHNMISHKLIKVVCMDIISFISKFSIFIERSLHDSKDGMTLEGMACYCYGITLYLCSDSSHTLGFKLTISLIFLILWFAHKSKRTVLYENILIFFL